MLDQLFVFRPHLLVALSHSSFPGLPPHRPAVGTPARGAFRQDVPREAWREPPLDAPGLERCKILWLTAKSDAKRLCNYVIDSKSSALLAHCPFPSFLSPGFLIVMCLIFQWMGKNGVLSAYNRMPIAGFDSFG